MARWLFDHISSCYFLVIVLVNVASSVPSSSRVERAVWIDQRYVTSTNFEKNSYAASNNAKSWLRMSGQKHKLLVANVFFKLYNHLAKTDTDAKDSVPCLTIVFDQPDAQPNFRLEEKPCSQADQPTTNGQKQQPPDDMTGFLTVDLDAEETRDTAHFVTTKMVDTKMPAWTNITGVNIVTAFKKTVTEGFTYKLMLQYYKSTDPGPNGEMFCQVYVDYNSSLGIRQITYLKCIGDNS